MQTVVFGTKGRAGQSLGSNLLRGEWLEGRLHTEPGSSEVRGAKAEKREEKLQRVVERTKRG